MKYYEKESSYPCSWENMVVAHWRRYPNPFSRHVTSEDTLARVLTATRLYTRRLLTKTNRMPKWGERFVSVRAVPVLEESIVDVSTRALRTYTRNLTYKRVMSVEERCDYVPDPQQPQEKTLIHRKAWITSELRGFSHLLQKFGFERFKKNVSKTEQGLAFTLNNRVLPSLPAVKKPEGGKTERAKIDIKKPTLPLHHSQ